jgi:hypothetical protein
MEGQVMEYRFWIEACYSVLESGLDMFLENLAGANLGSDQRRCSCHMNQTETVESEDEAITRKPHVA